MLILYLTSCHIHSNNCTFTALLKHTFESELWKRLLKKANKGKLLY
ncbi:hypothetical protein BC624_103258 [Flavobacterium granuli]|uniref:Uncharacterized protein n=1 Tax=Flavobacterium granuli TaxID=280093 RepID=A0A1M5N487_9FLAO|nr:hypothetical protein BC624_103258 [Flavobacterium granuli]SHG83989.1 hypothetical protein SAMN05443373_104258 [Flavobacterium granuli]